MGNYYIYEEIKIIFQHYGPPENFKIKEYEFNKLCLALELLPKDIIDKLRNDIAFLITSDNKAGWYISLECKDLIRKKGAIYISPHVLQEDLDPFEQKKIILHEIAHYVLNHKDSESLQKYEEDEIAANHQLEAWFSEYMKSKNNLDNLK